MSTEDKEVLVQAEKLADLLVSAKNEINSGEFLMLLLEMNSKIEAVTKIDYGSICGPSEYSFREGCF